MADSFRSAAKELSEDNVIKANIMVQIATNIALKTDAPKFNKELFEQKVNYALALTEKRSTFYPIIKGCEYGDD